MQTDRLQTGGGGQDRLHGAAGMMLDPLAQVRIRMLMPIVIDRGQGVMDFQHRDERSDRHEGEQYGKYDRSRDMAERVTSLE